MKKKVRYFEWGDEKPGYVTTSSPIRTAASGSEKRSRGKRPCGADTNSSARSRERDVVPR